MSNKNQSNKGNNLELVAGIAIPGKEKLKILPNSAKKLKTFGEIYEDEVMKLKTKGNTIREKNGDLVRTSEDGKELSKVSSDKIGKLKDKPLLNQEKNKIREEAIRKQLKEIDNEISEK